MTSTRDLVVGKNHLHDPRTTRHSSSSDRFANAFGGVIGIAVASVGIPWGVGGLSLSTILVCLSTATVILKYPSRLKTYRPNAVDLTLVVFILVMLVTEVVNAEQLLRTSNPYISQSWTFFYGAYVAGRLVARSQAEAVALMSGLLMAVPVASMIGVLQLLQVPVVIDFTTLATQGGSSVLDRYSEAGKLVRATGLIGHWTGYGSYLTVMTLCTLVLMKQAGSSPRRVACLVLIGMGIASTLTFSVLATYLVMVTAYYLIEKQVGRLVIGVATSIAVAGYLFGDAMSHRLFQQYGANSGALASSSGWIPETVMFRMSIWFRETIPAILERPITGWGNGVYSSGSAWPIRPNSLIWSSPESQWLGVLTQAGALGLLSLAFLVASFLYLARCLPSGIRLMVNLFIALCVVTSMTVSQFTNAGLPLALLLVLAALTGFSPAEPADRDVNRTPSVRGARTNRGKQRV